MKPAPARPDVPEIVAHRGDAEHFPENTLPGLESAWRHGLQYVEFDVQLAADGVPYLIHDADLERTTHTKGDLRLMTSGQLDGVDAGEPLRFGKRHTGTRLPRLAAVAELMADYPEARAFVEIKRASLAHHGRAPCLESILATLAAVLHRCIVISFDLEACRLARAAGGVRVGWVLDHDPDTQRQELEALGPEFVFCDHRRLAAGVPVPDGPWTWVVYEVTNAMLALELHERGIAMVESMAPLRLKRELEARARLHA